MRYIVYIYMYIWRERERYVWNSLEHRDSQVKIALLEQLPPVFYIEIWCPKRANTYVQRGQLFWITSIWVFVDFAGEILQLEKTCGGKSSDSLI